MKQDNKVEPVDSKRELAMNWWNKQDPLHQYNLCHRHFKNRGAHTLTGREIEEIYFKEYPLKVEPVAVENKDEKFENKQTVLFHEVFNIMLSKGDVYTYDFKAAIEEIRKRGYFIQSQSLPVTPVSAEDKIEEILAKYWYDNLYDKIDKQDYKAAEESRNTHHAWLDKNKHLFQPKEANNISKDVENWLTNIIRSNGSQTDVSLAARTLKSNYFKKPKN